MMDVNVFIFLFLNEMLGKLRNGNSKYVALA